MASSKARLALAEDMVSDGERVLDHQFRAWKELDEKVHNLVKLAIVGVAFGLAIATFAASADPLTNREPWIVLPLVAIGIATNVLALYFLAHAYSSVNGSRYAQCPPNPKWLIERLDASGMTMMIHKKSMLLGMKDAVDANVNSMEQVSKWRKRGVWTLAWLTLPVYLACVMVIGLFHLI